MKQREHFVTCGQMKLLEQRADAAGLSYYQMMENAGTRATELILERMGYGHRPELDRSDKKVAEQILTQLPAGKEEVFAKHLEKLNATSGEEIRALLFCGKGNNGGDGFVVARLLCQRGYQVTVVLVDGEPKTTDAIENFKLLRELPVKILDMKTDDRALMKLKTVPHLVIDAIYGTGFHGTLQSNALKAAIYINRYSKTLLDEDGGRETLVVALDIPSGLSGDLTNEKELDRNTVTAHYTITFHAKKPVHLQPFARSYCGEILVADIGIDEEKLWNL